MISRHFDLMGAVLQVHAEDDRLADRFAALVKESEQGAGPEAVERAMAERGIAYTRRHRVYGLDPAEKVAHLKDHDEPYDLFIGIPVHTVPDVVTRAGLTENGWVKVDPLTLATAFPGVYALGDCTDTGIPKAGVFAESAARAVADSIVSSVKGEVRSPTTGQGCASWRWGRARSAGSTFISAPQVARPPPCSARPSAMRLRKRSSAPYDGRAGSGSDPIWWASYHRSLAASPSLPAVRSKPATDRTGGSGAGTAATRPPQPPRAWPPVGARRWEWLCCIRHTRVSAPTEARDTRLPKGIRARRFRAGPRRSARLALRSRS